MALIDLTQFMFPTGEARDRQLEVPDDVHAKWRELTDAGFRIECEWLSAGYVSATITDPERGDMEIKLCKDGDPAAAEAALHDMIRRFDGDKARNWIAQYDADEATA